MYRQVIRPVLFLFDPEKVHHFTFGLIKWWFRVPFAGMISRKLFNCQDPSLERSLFGLTFPNPVGLAAGFDKDARLTGELSDFGFGFIEIGTVTPEPQAGNEKPRLFRLPSDQAIINRMGFNNEGVAAVARRLAERKKGLIIGGNIGKNKWTSNEQALEDYRKCLVALHPHVDYFAVNVSSPNTPGLRELQEKEPLRALLTGVKTIVNSMQPVRPVLLKIAPDLTEGQLDDIVYILKDTQMDGVIATNTTTSRESLTTDPGLVAGIGAGGLSGRPLREKSTNVIRYLRLKLGPEFPIIGVGGILTAEDAVEKIAAGADLVQLYTGFIYTGPGLVSAICHAISQGIQTKVRPE